MNGTTFKTKVIPATTKASRLKPFKNSSDMQMYSGTQLGESDSIYSGLRGLANNSPRFDTNDDTLGTTRDHVHVEGDRNRLSSIGSSDGSSDSKSS